jgi:hypothetical protein
VFCVRFLFSIKTPVPESNKDRGLCHELETQNLLTTNYSPSILQMVVVSSKIPALIGQRTVEGKGQEEATISEGS